jgi:phosphoglycolate phosphatase
LRDSFPEIFGTSWEDARDVFHRRFHERHLDTLCHLPGAPELLGELAASGIYLAVVSNKNGTVLRREAEHLGWTGHFGRIVGASDAARDKPAGDPVLMALEKSGLSPGPEVWFVGDAGIDMECAHGTGCLPVLISSEPHNTKEFQLFPPEISLVDLASLRSFLHVHIPRPL